MQKNQKKVIMKSRENAKKKRFFRHISGIFGRKNFFSENRAPSHSGHGILHLCAKNHKKLMSQSREKLVTDARTDERTDNG